MVYCAFSLLFLQRFLDISSQLVKPCHEALNIRKGQKSHSEHQTLFTRPKMKFPICPVDMKSDISLTVYFTPILQRIEPNVVCACVHFIYICEGLGTRILPNVICCSWSPHLKCVLNLHLRHSCTFAYKTRRTFILVFS